MIDMRNYVQTEKIDYLMTVREDNFNISPLEAVRMTRCVIALCLWPRAIVHQVVNNTMGR